MLLEKQITLAPLGLHKQVQAWETDNRDVIEAGEEMRLVAIVGKHATRSKLCEKLDEQLIVLALGHYLPLLK